MSVVYKLSCIDPTITKIYIGSTNNLIRRRSQHKYNVLTDYGKEYNRKVYRFIRHNGFWENWKVDILVNVKTNNIKHLRMVEQLYINSLKPELNIFKKCY